MLIKDLVKIDEHGAFRSDVQLSDYDDPKLNLDLLRSYIFTVSAPFAGGAGRDFSAKDVLDRLKSAFSVERFENRFVLTANYGHGKSHLALTLANFFARPAESEEVRIIFKRLEQVLNNPAALSGYREFKQSKGEFLVIRLRGDGFDDLQDGFMRALEHALREHNKTRDINLPFWHSHAVKWLDSLSGESRQKVELFLAGYNTDLASLRQEIRKSESYELIREAFKHMIGFYPDFGREVSLKDLVIWAVDEVCAPNGMGGLLILFDEFSLFLQKYATSRMAGKLQDLLNGISDRQGKSAFLAFTQIDIDSVLDTYTQRNPHQDVQKELDRLPRDKRARLFSLMEGVLDAYLKQDESAWQAWMQQHQHIRPVMSRNREMLYDYFSRRYDVTLQWGPEKTEQVVVKGCFPLHPLTTAILSNHEFEAGTGENPRTALHFVRDRWEKGLDEQSAERADSSPNFVFAIELVDFFGKQISKTCYEEYQAALQNSRIELNEKHHAALKALLLQKAISNLDRRKIKGSAQIELLSALSGLSNTLLEDVLRELSECRAIMFDRNENFYKLLPAGARSLEAERIIENAFQKTPLDRNLLDEIAKDIPTLEIPQKFGNAKDWAPRQVILTKEYFNSQVLKILLLPYRTSDAGIEESPRGLVIWLLAQTEDEKKYLRQNAEKILGDTLGASTHPLPVVIILPKQPTPSLFETARRKKTLATLSENDREKIGRNTYQYEDELAQIEFKTNFENFFDPKRYGDLLRQSHEYVLPAAYRPYIDIRKDISLKDVLSQIYDRAYKYRVEFSDRPLNARGVNHLRTAVENVARWLLTDTVGKSIENLNNIDMQYKIAHHFLTEKWGLLTPKQYTIQPPTLQQLREAWVKLDETFPPGCKEIHAKEILMELLNPPYGHDYNTLILLLAAWIGFHRHEIRISMGGALFPLEDFRDNFTEAKGPKDFLNRLVVTNPLAISRINTDEMFAEVDVIIEQIRQNHRFKNIPEAQQSIAKLQQAQENPSLSPERREAIKSYAPRLEKDISDAQNYDTKASKFLDDLLNTNLKDLLSLGDSLKNLIPPALVSPSQPLPDQLRKTWETRLEDELDIFCKRNSELRDLSEYKHKQNQLTKAQSPLNKYPVLLSKVEKALETLNQRYGELKQAESEKPILAEINGMAQSAGLADLYRYQKRLAEFKNLSPETEKLRQDKAMEIDNRIRQFEQLPEILSNGINDSNSQDSIRKQKDFLFRNLDHVQATPLHQSLTAIKERIERLETFFEQVEAFDRMPKQSPTDLSTLAKQIQNLQAEFKTWLSPAQIDLLESRKQQLVQIGQQKMWEAQEWLKKLEYRYNAGETPNELLRTAQNPPAFLLADDIAKLKQLREILQKKVEEDRLLKIEALFTELSPDARRECLQRLQSIMGKL